LPTDLIDTAFLTSPQAARLAQVTAETWISWWKRGAPDFPQPLNVRGRYKSPRAKVLAFLGLTSVKEGTGHGA
jgi:hypothetical protein